MGLLRRLRGRTRPDLSASRSAEDVDLDSLLALVAETMGFICSFTPDGGSLTLGGGDGRDRVVNLVGLRREAGRRSREDWPMLVSEHLAHAVSGEPFDACNLTPIRPLLRARVHAADDLALPDPSRIIARHLSADLIEVLSIGARPVRPEEAFCWPIPPGQALDVALENALADERPSVSSLDLGGVGVTVLSAPSAAAHLRSLSKYVAVPADGVLVVLPHPGAVVLHPVDGIGVVRAIERLRMFAQREHDSHPQGLSPHVYWWRCDSKHGDSKHGDSKHGDSKHGNARHVGSKHGDHGGRLTRIQADLVAQDGQTRLVVAPPPEFARLLARIAGRP